MDASPKTTPVATHHDETGRLLEPMIPGNDIANAKIGRPIEGHQISKPQSSAVAKLLQTLGKGNDQSQTQDGWSDSEKTDDTAVALTLQR